MRGLCSQAFGADLPLDAPFELDNRGKRSIALNLQHAGYGTEGAERDRPTCAISAWWARAGIALSLVPEGGEPPHARGGMGDHTTAIAAVSATCAALVARQRTGRGQLVSTSLLRTGAYVLGRQCERAPATRPARASAGPAAGAVSAAELLPQQRRPVVLVAPPPGRSARFDWRGRPRRAPERRAFGDLRTRRRHKTARIAVLDEIFGPCADGARGGPLRPVGMWWARVQSVAEMLDDPQVRAAACSPRSR